MWYHLSHARVLKLGKLVSMHLYIYILVTLIFILRWFVILCENESSTNIFKNVKILFRKTNSPSQQGSLSFSDYLLTDSLIDLLLFNDHL